MKTVTKAMIAWGIVLLALGIMAGCRKSEVENSKEVSTDQTRILGKYINQDDPRKYLELKKDGTFLIHEITLDTNGKWEIVGSEIRLHLPTGLTMAEEIDGHTIIYPEGERWVKEEGKEPISESINGKAARDIARARMAIIEDALAKFYIDCGRYPRDSERLDALLVAPLDLDNKWNGPYIKRSYLLDPWQNPYVYVAQGQYNPGSFDLISYGADGAEGGEGDNADMVND